VKLAESTVVDPSLRGGWANLWLKHAGATASVRLGLHTLLYYRITSIARVVANVSPVEARDANG
jgi:hypothetical protein